MTFTISTVDGTAISVDGEDYTERSENITILGTDNPDYDESNAGTYTFDVTITNDKIKETLLEENFTVKLSNISDNVQLEGRTFTATGTIIDDDNAPVINENFLEARVSEEGLENGIADSKDYDDNPDTTFDTTDGKTFTGELATDADGDTLTFNFTAPTEVMWSGGEQVKWDISNPGYLRGYIGTEQDTTDVLTVTVNQINNTYTYTVELNAPITHPENSYEDEFVLNIPFTVTDGANPVSSTLKVTIEDDMPSAEIKEEAPSITIDNTFTQDEINTLASLDALNAFENFSYDEVNGVSNTVTFNLSDYYDFYGADGAGTIEFGEVYYMDGTDKVILDSDFEISLDGTTVTLKQNDILNSEISGIVKLPIYITDADGDKVKVKDDLAVEISEYTELDKIIRLKVKEETVSEGNKALFDLTLNKSLTTRYIKLESGDTNDSAEDDDYNITTLTYTKTYTNTAGEPVVETITIAPKDGKYEIPPLVSDFIVTVQTVDDNDNPVFEGPEEFTITASYVDEDPVSASDTAIIVDDGSIDGGDNDKPEVSITATVAKAVEPYTDVNGNTVNPLPNVKFVVSQNNKSDFDTFVTVKAEVLDVEASDFTSITIGETTYTSNSEIQDFLDKLSSPKGILVQIDSGDTEAPEIVFNVADDNVYENIENIELQISIDEVEGEDSVATVGDNHTAIAKIEDDDNPDTPDYDNDGDAPVARLSEEGLDNGIAEEQIEGDETDTTNEKSVTINIDEDIKVKSFRTEEGKPFEIYSSQTGEVLKSGGKEVLWLGVGSDNLTGYTLDGLDLVQLFANPSLGLGTVTADITVSIKNGTDISELTDLQVLRDLDGDGVFNFENVINNDEINLNQSDFTDGNIRLSNDSNIDDLSNIEITINIKVNDIPQTITITLDEIFNGVIQIDGSTAGAIQVDLLGPVDHAVNSVEDVLSIDIPFTHPNADSNDYTSVLKVEIEDDSPSDTITIETSVTDGTTIETLLNDRTLAEVLGLDSEAQVFLDTLTNQTALAIELVTNPSFITDGLSSISTLDTYLEQDLQTQINNSIVTTQVIPGVVESIDTVETVKNIENLLNNLSVNDLNADGLTQLATQLTNESGISTFTAKNGTISSTMNIDLNDVIGKFIDFGADGFGGIGLRTETGNIIINPTDGSIDLGMIEGLEAQLDSTTNILKLTNADISNTIEFATDAQITIPGLYVYDADGDETDITLIVKADAEANTTNIAQLQGDVMELTGESIDLTTVNNVSGVNTLDLTNDTADTLNINFNDILDMTDENADGVNQLIINGETGDVINLESTDYLGNEIVWSTNTTQTSPDGTTYNVYTTGDSSSVRVLVDDNITVDP